MALATATSGMIARSKQNVPPTWLTLFTFTEFVKSALVATLANATCVFGALTAEFASFPVVTAALAIFLVFTAPFLMFLVLTAFLPRFRA